MKTLKEYQQERTAIIRSSGTPDFVIEQLKEKIVAHFTKDIENAFDYVVKNGDKLYYNLPFFDVRLEIREFSRLESHSPQEFEYLEKEAIKLITPQEIVDRLKDIFNKLGFKTI